jgi:hypothetical protein
LWNILVVNNGGTAYNNCRLNLILRDRLTGQEIFTASTALFNIASGAKQFNINTLSPVQYNYLAGIGNNNLQALIPVGVYTACYSLSGYSLKDVTLAEDCVQFDAEPLSPPMLIFPADSSALDNKPNQFSWTPPTPAAMFSQLHYEILITQVQEGQKADEAIQQNIPFYTEGGLFNSLLNYPGSAWAFEKDKWYAWQIVAKDDKSYAAKSEVWVFKINTGTKTNTDKEAFAEVKPFYSGKKYYFTSSINFSFSNPYTTKPLDYSITSVATNKKLIHLPTIKMVEGLNQVSIEVGKIKGIQKNEQYVIEIYNLGSGTQYLNFIIKE